MEHTAPQSRGRTDLSEHQQAFGTLQDVYPVRAALDILRGRWKPSILFELKAKPRRGSESQSVSPRISPRALTAWLKQWEAAGWVDRRVYAEVPVRVEYQL